ncbi:MAG: hypothetical protein PVJ32_04635 [Anaerolineales bacterium]|jgi:succinate dehydrogenase / fumarate reductase cytochrome b subunit
MTEPRRTRRIIQRRRIVDWFRVLGRSVGTWAFALNRLTGLGLVLYLFIHLGVLSLLAQGESRWDAFIRLAKSPLFLALDVVLMFGILFHGLNGVRLSLVGLGVGVRQQRRMFWVLMAIGGAILAVAGWAVFGG